MLTSVKQHWLALDVSYDQMPWRNHDPTIEPVLGWSYCQITFRVAEIREEIASAQPCRTGKPRSRLDIGDRVLIASGLVT